MAMKEELKDLEIKKVSEELTEQDLKKVSGGIDCKNDNCREHKSFFFSSD